LFVLVACRVERRGWVGVRRGAGKADEFGGGVGVHGQGHGRRGCTGGDDGGAVHGVERVEPRLVFAVESRPGHASASETLDTYSHLWPDSEDRTRQAIDAVLGAPASSSRHAVGD
jgi:hypothetical protein